MTSISTEAEPDTAAHALRTLLRFLGMVGCREAIVTACVIAGLLQAVLDAKTAQLSLRQTLP